MTFEVTCDEAVPDLFTAPRSRIPVSGAETNWALICHAGSAPEASIGSKPIGGELFLRVGEVTRNVKEILTRILAAPTLSARKRKGARFRAASRGASSLSRTRERGFPGGSHASASPMGQGRSA